MDIAALLDMGVKAHASDLHIIPGLSPLLRIDGLLAPIKKSAVLTPADTKAMIYSLMSTDELQAFETNLVVELGINIPAIGSFRASLYHQALGVAGVFRLIPGIVPDVDSLEIPQAIRSLLVLPHGLILVAGPTGSGKSTTLAAMIEFINANLANNIITIEDPIEFTFHPKRSIINQLQVGRDTVDFATALRASLRQDPNVIMLGELRDLETMRLALTAAETGHLVLATIHASSAPLAVSRFADVFPSEEKNRVRSLLSETLQAVVCQTLVRKIAGGRVAAFEVMLSTASVRNFIRQDLTAHMESAIQTSGNKGMFTLEQYLSILVKKGTINVGTANSALMARASTKEDKTHDTNHK